MSSRRNEQGGIVDFLLITSVVVALLLGAVWLAKNQGRTAKTNSTPTAQTPEKTDENKTNQPTNIDTTTGNTAVPSPTPTATTTPSTTAPSTTESATTVPRSGPSTAEVIPSAGLESSVMTVLSISFVSAGVYAYVQSQKRVRTSALK